MSYELSVVIPARNEEYLRLTTEDVLQNSGPQTEVIVILDGAWSRPGLVQHDRLQIVHLPESIGQRAATNLGIRMSTAPYVMKLDAHCSTAPGFDTVLLRDAKILGPDVVQIPAQYNLHVFDWVCNKCTHRFYQGPDLPECPDCKAVGTMEKQIMWQPRKRRLTTSWRFDPNLHFQYWTAYGKQHPEPIHDVMSCLGACWLVDRKHFLSLGALDETHGSWGQMGTEVACKYWLSGGRMVVNKNTWFSHLFRTRPGFGFPYPLSGGQQEQARKHSRWLWLEGNWPLAIHPLQWLVDKFAPVPDWPVAPPVSKKTGMVYYTDNRLDPVIRDAVKRQLHTGINGSPLVTVGLKSGETSIVIEASRGHLTMFRQILAGLEALDTEYAFLCEHDVLYHPSHFEFRPLVDDIFYYNLNVWKMDAATGKAVTYVTKQTSGLCANRKLLVEHYRKRIALVEKNGFSRKMGFEPGSHRRPERVDDYRSDVWRSEFPNIDIRHTMNLTASRWSPLEFRSQKNCKGWTEADVIPGWGPTVDILASMRP